MSALAVPTIKQLHRGYLLGLARSCAPVFAKLLREENPTLSNVALSEIVVAPHYSSQWADVCREQTQNTVDLLLKAGENVIDAHRTAAIVPDVMLAELEFVLNADNDGIFPDPRSRLLMATRDRCLEAAREGVNDVDDDRTIGRMWRLAMLHEAGPDRRSSKVAA